MDEIQNKFTIPSLQPDLKRRLTWRTFIVPLFFIVIHFFLANVVALAYVLTAVALESYRTGATLLVLLEDQEKLNLILRSDFPIIAVIIGAAMIPICLIYLTLNGKRDERVWLTEKPRLTLLLPALAMTIGVLGLTNIWFVILEGVKEHMPVIQTWMDDYIALAESFSADSGYFWLIFGICIVTPVLEELIFRGIIQGELRKSMPEWAAIVIQAVLFAAYHMQPIQSSYVIVPGLLLGLAYYWSRSIWVPIIMHCLFNFMGGVLPTLFADNEAVLNSLAIMQFGFILVGLAAAAYLYLNRRQKKSAR